MQIDCYGSAQYKLSWHSLEPLVKIKTISTAGVGGGGGGVLPIMAYTGGRLHPRGVPFQALEGEYMKGRGFY